MERRPRLVFLVPPLLGPLQPEIASQCQSGRFCGLRPNSRHNKARAERTAIQGVVRSHEQTLRRCRRHFDACRFPAAFRVVVRAGANRRAIRSRRAGRDCADHARRRARAVPVRDSVERCVRRGRRGRCVRAEPGPAYGPEPTGHAPGRAFLRSNRAAGPLCRDQYHGGGRAPAQGRRPDCRRAPAQVGLQHGAPPSYGCGMGVAEPVRRKRRQPEQADHEIRAGEHRQA